jgi:hypothetical protein
MLLGAHPEIATVSEMTGLIDRVDVDDYRCSCGNLIRDCVFWREVAHQMQYRGFQFDLADFGTRFTLSQKGVSKRLQFSDLGLPALNKMRDQILFHAPGAAKKLREVAERNLALAEITLAITGKSTFLDASKAPHRIRYLRRFADADLKVIHLTRDPRGYVTSKCSNCWSDEKCIRRAAREWSRRNRQIDEVLGDLPSEKHMRVRYEDLCKNPLETMQAVCDFCGVSPPDRLPDIGHSDHHVVGNRMRTTRNIVIRQDTKWRSALSQQAQDEILNITKQDALRYGYTINGPDKSF